jgi:sulfhydrogenase subunit beta (sulfur reductase)
MSLFHHRGNNRMMKIITKEEYAKILDSLVKDFEIVGPVERAGKGIFYQAVKNAGELYLGSGFAIEPAKKFFLNPSEWLYSGKFQEGHDLIEDLPVSNAPRILIGIRPCEARGLELLDKVFDSDFKDRSYIDNRNRTIIVGLSCAAADENCFCTSMSGSPVESRGMDAILHSTGDNFIVDIISEKGQALFGETGRDLSDAEKKELQSELEKRKASVTKKIEPPENLPEVFESPYWEKVSRACLSCGICTFLCPTCHCFDLVDEDRRRLRCYDGCAFSDFTLEASGGNPRQTKKDRYRQRVYHKFDFFRKNFGENLCVGCGRCVRHCPVKIDIAEIAAHAPITEKS